MSKAHSWQGISVALLAIGLMACVSDPRTQASGSISRATEKAGSVMHTRQWRNLFYGYDTLSYRLVAQDSDRFRSYRLAVTADYGDTKRRYYASRSADRSIRLLANYRHEIGRCDIFNSLLSACLFRDQFDINLTAAEITDAQKNDLHIILRSNTRDLETITLPANYVRDFLLASSAN
jgi:hypothetical protein